MSLRSATDRLDGYKTALQHNGIDVDESLIQEDDYLRERGYEAATKLLSSENRPTAIVASNDFTALGTMEAAHDIWA